MPRDSKRRVALLTGFLVLLIIVFTLFVVIGYIGCAQLLQKRALSYYKKERSVIFR
jgi:uncharacterized membrane protein